MVGILILAVVVWMAVLTIGLLHNFVSVFRFDFCVPKGTMDPVTNYVPFPTRLALG